MVVGFTSACATYPAMKEVKHIGFDSENDGVKKGKSLGLIEGDDCVFHVFGYWLGGYPTLNRAIHNARSGKRTAVTDSLSGRGGSTADGGVRYLNDVKYNYSGFDAKFFGKSCIEVSAMGYK